MNFHTIFIMKIKTKLLFIIIIMLFSIILISTALYFAMYSTDKIEKETDKLERLHVSILNEEMLINRILSQSIYVLSVDDFFMAVEQSNAAFEDVKHIDYIRSLNPNVTKALDITTSWYEFRLDNLIRFKDKEIKFRESVMDLFIFTNSFNFVKIYLDKSFMYDISTERINQFNDVLTDFTYEHSVYENILERCVTSINEQFNTIELEVNKITERIFLFTGIAVLFLLGLNFTISIIFANSIVANIHKIDESVKSLSHGDFSMDLNIKSKDEIGVLADDFLDFKKEFRRKLDSINVFMNDIQSQGTITKEKYAEEMEKKIGVMFNTTDNGIRSKEIDKKCKKYNLSKREKEIILLLESGITYKQMAEDLSVSFSTVNTHMNNIYKKCKVRKKSELIKLFYKK